MRLLVELLLGLVLLSTAADAGLFYRVKGEFKCYGQPAKDIDFLIVEHDPNENDIVQFKVDDWFDYTGNDHDSWGDFQDPLELSVHAGFTCGDCKGELYQYIEYDDGQFSSDVKALDHPAIFGLVELSDACRYGVVKPKYSDWDDLDLRKQWIVRNENSDIRGHFSRID
uniref:Transthyretin/hydroxyisourate hydrolase domain-containing protein n=1 Tax=Panagrellus redivivus TaxID=6233 RepID=A0A7E4W051_PANRE